VANWNNTYREGQIPSGGTINDTTPGRSIARTITEIQEKAITDVSVQGDSRISAGVQVIGNTASIQLGVDMGEVPEPSASPPRNTDAGPAITGSSNLYAREDHKHQADTGVPVSISSGGNSEGSSLLLSRADHVHSLPTSIFSSPPFNGKNETITIVTGVVFSNNQLLRRQRVFTYSNGLLTNVGPQTESVILSFGSFSCP
jgi:hypothetical protein